MVGELLHACAFAATAVSTCCLAASRPKIRVRELALAVVMLGAMADIVLGTNMLAPLWWAALVGVVALTTVVPIRGRTLPRGPARSTIAMDALGGILMAALIVVMMNSDAMVASTVSAASVHAGHGGASPTRIAIGVVVASVVFAAVCVSMVFRMPQGSAMPVRLRTVAQAGSLSMAASVVLMAAAVVL